MTKSKPRKDTSPPLDDFQQALKDSEELHRIILTNISDSVFLTDSSGVFTFICPNVDNIFGYSFSEIYEMKNISTLLGKDLFDPRRLESVSEIRNIEKVVRDKFGADHTVLVNVKNVGIRYGSRLFTCRDITEYKRLKGELTKSLAAHDRTQKDFLVFFNLSGDLFCIIDQDRFRTINPSWSNSLGYTLDQLKGRSLEEIVHPEDLAMTMAIRHKLRSGDIVQYENRFRHKDGYYKWFSWSVTMSDEGLVHAVGRDITAKKKAEDDMKRRLLRFKLEPGRTYLVDETSPMAILEALNDLMGINYKGLVFTRRNRETFFVRNGSPLKYHWMADRPGKDMIPPDPELLFRTIEGVPDDHVVVLDSLEFIHDRIGPEKTLELVRRIREEAYFKKQIVILGVDGACLDQRFRTRLLKEAETMDRFPVTALPGVSSEILKTVQEQNSFGSRPTRTQLCKLLGLSQPTVRKHTKELIESGMLYQYHRGKGIVVEVTEQGLRFLRL